MSVEAFVSDEALTIYILAWAAILIGAIHIRGMVRHAHLSWYEALFPFLRKSSDDNAGRGVDSRLLEKTEQLNANLEETASAMNKGFGEITRTIRDMYDRLEPMRYAELGGVAADVGVASVPGPLSADDLTRIKGIGRVLDLKLHDLGITTFRQIAEFTAADIARVDAALNTPGRIEREEWVEQARKILGDDAA